MANESSSSSFSRGSAVNFRSDDYSSRISAIPDKRRSKEQEADNEENKSNQQKEEFKASEYVDKSAQLRASLNSLAIINAAGVLKNNKIQIPGLKSFSSIIEDTK